MPLRSLIIDFNSYFASVEQLLVPELRGRPMAVVPVVTDSTCCIAASKEAKRFGVKTGTEVREARKLCRDIVFVESRAKEYVEIHDLLMEAIENCTHIEEIMSIDEAWCQLTGKQRERKNAEALAREMKEAVARVAEKQSSQRHRCSAAETLTCSIGIAPNPWLAKVASDMKKPDGLIVIEDRDLPQVLFPLELRDFCGIGPNMERRLKECGIRTVERLCAASEKELRQAWHSVEGTRVWHMLRGAYIPRGPHRKRVIGHSHVLPPELRYDSGARAVCDRLVQKAAMRLRKAGYCAGGLHLSVRYQDRKWKDEIVFTETQDTMEFLHALDALWERRGVHGVTPKKVGVTFFRLRPMQGRTPMFQAIHQDHSALCAAVDKVNLGFGSNKVYFGGAHGALKYTPMRIAFTRIPDPATEG
jgi:DNA polymerase-4